MTNQKYLFAIKNRIIQSKLDEEMRNYIKGLEGEIFIKCILDEYPDLHYLYNYQINHKNRVQIDFLIVTDDALLHFEIKHYSGDYTIKDGQLMNEFGNMFYTPFQQLRRANHELNFLISHFKINKPVQSYLIFTNPKFTLKGSIPSQFNILLPTELHKFQYMFKNQNTQENLRILRLFQREYKDFSHIYKNNNRVPMSCLIPGLKCPKCKSMNTIVNEDCKKNLTCRKCDFKDVRQNIYLFNLLELYICLGESFTLSEAQEWCDVENKHTIRRVCEKYFNSTNKNPKKYFTISKGK
ncbi:nuclease-related domain-containing protein [Mammaliicoccus sp. Dog046]|uniref:nuclease-related domain-containing protein n=1 Tax=Mammaliicoccus sp. Dog046 TaxID=3034233 RepID=UPI002B2603DA|nr:nuclease-related domain-containing protein [Mammaliicoccus sp. Dog046]WQK85721.1 nuclease-related domain-containing protein [Mammaliicoccus sp. Dog046]